MRQVPALMLNKCQFSDRDNETSDLKDFNCQVKIEQIIDNEY